MTPSDEQFREMLLARASRADSNGLLDDARLVALAAGRGRMDRLSLRWPATAATIAVAVVLVAAIWSIQAPFGPRITPIASGLPTVGPGSTLPHVSAAPSQSKAASLTPVPNADVTCLGVPEGYCLKAVELVRHSSLERIDAEPAVIVANTCPPGVFCALGAHAVLIATHPGWHQRSDLHFVSVSGIREPEAVAPWPEAAGVPGSVIEALPPPAEPSPDGRVAWTVAQLLARPLSEPPVELVVTGWLVASRPIECRTWPVPSGQLDFGCSERDWLTDREFQPSRGSSVVPPRVGIRVPNGSYRRYAIAPTSGQAKNVPRYGTYFVRAHVGSACEFLGPSTAGLPCSGPPAWIVEITGRI